jgi:hypothetical protein
MANRRLVSSVPHVYLSKLTTYKQFNNNLLERLELPSGSQSIQGSNQEEINNTLRLDITSCIEKLYIHKYMPKPDLLDASLTEMYLVSSFQSSL